MTLWLNLVKELTWKNIDASSFEVGARALMLNKVF